MFNLKNLHKAFFLAAIALSVFYIAGVNDLSVKGFVLSELKQEKNNLAEANSKLELNALALGSYSNIRKRADALQMIPAGAVNYLTAGAEIMAKK